MAKQIAFQGMTLFLFLSGIVFLFIVPFLPWFYWGNSIVIFSNQTPSLIYLFQQGFPLLQFYLPIYIAGVALAIFVAARVRRPVFYQGIIPAVFPAYLVVFAGFPFLYVVETSGIVAAFLGSILLEACYFSYRKNAKATSKVDTTLTDDLPV